jgi:hypothetical protein
VLDPIIKVVLDARAAHEQRRSVNCDAHPHQYVIDWRFMAAYAAAGHHHTHHHVHTRRALS